MFKIRSKWNHQDYIKIEWNLGKRCNLDCTYCPAYIHDNYSKHTDISILKKTVDKLASLDKPVRLSLTGGEPSVHPKIEELLYHIRYKGIEWLSMTTNATRPYTWYLDQQKYITQYVFSLHFESEYSKHLYTILSVVEASSIPILIHIMAHHQHMLKVREAVKVLENTPHVIRRIRWTEGDHDLFDDLRYDYEDLEWIKERNGTAKANCVIDDIEEMHANEIIKLHLNKFKDWTCNAGIESLMINWDGEVYRATCRVGGSLGNIYDGTFNIPEDPIVCTRNFCTCEADIPITKNSYQM